MTAGGLRGRRLAGAALLSVAVSCTVPAWAQDAATWLRRAANAARELNYVGTIVYQSGTRSEVSRLTHFSDGAEEIGKLVSLDGPQREVIRTRDEVTGYLPDRKLVRVEARTFRNVFPSIAPAQLATLSEHYTFRTAENARIAGVETQAVVFEPKDGLRYGHKFWADVPTGLLIKARLLDERGATIEQFAFTDISIGVRIDREAVRPTFLAQAPEWRVQKSLPPEGQTVETGWTVKQLPPGFRKVVEGYRSMRGKREQVAHLVFSDGLVAVSVFIEPLAATHKQLGASQQGAIHVFSRQVDDHMVTVLGEAPGATIRQIAQSVDRR